MKKLVCETEMERKIETVLQIRLSERERERRRGARDKEGTFLLPPRRAEDKLSINYSRRLFLNCLKL